MFVASETVNSAKMLIALARDMSINGARCLECPCSDRSSPIEVFGRRDEWDIASLLESMVDGAYFPCKDAVNLLSTSDAELQVCNSMRRGKGQRPLGPRV